MIETEIRRKKSVVFVIFSTAFRKPDISVIYRGGITRGTTGPRCQKRDVRSVSLRLTRTVTQPDGGGGALWRSLLGGVRRPRTSTRARIFLTVVVSVVRVSGRDRREGHCRRYDDNTHRGGGSGAMILLYTTCTPRATTRGGTYTTHARATTLARAALIDFSPERGRRRDRPVVVAGATALRLRVGLS